MSPGFILCQESSLENRNLPCHACTELRNLGCRKCGAVFGVMDVHFCKPEPEALAGDQNDKPADDLDWNVANK